MSQVHTEKGLRCGENREQFQHEIKGINYCAEAKAGTKAIVGNKTVNITNVTHEEGEPDEHTGDTQLETTIISTSAMVSTEATEIAVTAPYTIYDSLGMTAEELNQIKEELANE